MARRRAGQVRGGELVALTMAAALLFFVGREALRAGREKASGHPTRAPTVEDPAPTAPVAQAGRPTRGDSLPARQTVVTRPAGRPDRAEVRRRIELGAQGTYMRDMLADGDSMLTRWPDRMLDPVRVWVQRSATVPDWTPELAHVGREAFTEWGEVGFPVRFTFTLDSAGAEIRVIFADRVTEKNRLGMTTHRHDQDGWIVSADIVIATHDTSGIALAPSLISAIARHEVGHALGMAHSRDRGTIMYPESHTLAITDADRATVKLLYTLPPGSVK